MSLKEDKILTVLVNILFISSFRGSTLHRKQYIGHLVNMQPNPIYVYLEFLAQSEAIIQNCTITPKETKLCTAIIFQ